MSTKISFEFPLLTETFEADEFMVEGLKREKLLNLERDEPPAVFPSLMT